jgi:hypothetical protein
MRAATGLRIMTGLALATAGSGGALTGDAPDTVRLRTAYRDAAAVAAAEAHAYRAHCACAFAAVVRGSPAQLQSIADRSGVRAVDPAPEVSGLDRAEFRPPLPEQRSTVPAEPRSATGTAPPGAPPVAPVTPPPLPSSSGAAVTSASSDDPAAGSGPSDPASEERSAVPSAPVPTPDPGVPSPGPGASRGRSGR